MQSLFKVTKLIAESFRDALKELPLMLQGLRKSCICSLGEVLGNFGKLPDGCNPVDGLATDPGVLLRGFSNEASKVAVPGHDCTVKMGKGFFGSGNIVGSDNEDTF